MQKANLLVIQEAGVLLRVKHLQQRAGRVAVMPSPNLIYLVDEHKWVLRVDTLEGLNDLPRKSTE